MVHSCDVPGFHYQMSTTWEMPPGITPFDVVYWIGYAVEHSEELRLANVVIDCHGGPGILYVGGKDYPPVSGGNLSWFSMLRNKSIGTVWLVACQVALGSKGQGFCRQLARTLGCDVIAADAPQFTENSYIRGNCPFGTIDDFEGTMYRFSPSKDK